MSTFDETRARRYVLGQLSEEEADALEAEYFASGEALERVWGIENDLVDGFVAGELAPEERAAFEKHYLASPLHQDRVATARILRATTQGRETAPRRVPTWPVWVTLAATLVLLLASLWMRERPQATTGPVAQATPVATAPTQTATTAEPETRPLPKTTVAAFALSPMLLRGGQPTPILRVPRGTDEIAITLQGERPDGIALGTRLPFAVATVEGARVATGHVRVEADSLGVARIATVRVPAGDYILSVGSPRASDGPLRQYFFRLVTGQPGTP